MKWVVLFILMGITFQPSPAAGNERSPTESSQTRNSETHSSRSGPAHTVRARYSKGRRRTHAAPAPTYQLHPDPDRYQEIQKALAEKGYFQGEVNGQWEQDSVDALTRFQTEQRLPNDGKINALSLAALGLGPKHDNLGVSESATTSPQPALPK